MDIVNGVDDQDLMAIRAQLLQYNYPVMLRWFWEFNLNTTNPVENPNSNNGCFQTPDPQHSIPALTTQFQEAFQHVRAVLLGSPPQPNITFIWNPNAWNAPGSDNYSDTNTAPVEPWSYYPGANYVDWIAFDGYSRLDSSGIPYTFDKIFQYDINYVTDPSFGNKPVMIGETGACNNYPVPNNQTWQAQYLSSIQTELDNGIQYPTLAAFMYFDAPGQYKFVPYGTTCDWSLINTDQSFGLTQFDGIGADPLFKYMVAQ